MIETPFRPKIETPSVIQEPSVWRETQNELTPFLNQDARTAFHTVTAALYACSTPDLVQQVLQSKNKIASNVHNSWESVLTWLKAQTDSQLSFQLADIFPFVTEKYGPLAFSIRALKNYYKRMIPVTLPYAQEIHHLAEHISKETVVFSSSTINPIETNSPEIAWLNNIQKTFDQASIPIETKDQLTDSLREKYAAALVESTQPYLSPKEKKLKITSLKRRMVFLPSGTDIPAVIRMAYPNRSDRNFAFSAELGSDTGKAFSRGEVPSMKDRPLAASIQAAYHQQFLLRNADLAAKTGSLLVDELNQFIDRSEQNYLKPYITIGLPPKTGIISPEIKSFIRDNISQPKCQLLLDFAQDRLHDDPQFEQDILSPVVDGKVDYMSTPSKYLGSFPFAGLMILSEETYKALAAQGNTYSEDPTTVSFFKRGYLSPELTTSLGLENITEFDSALMSKLQVSHQAFYDRHCSKLLSPSDWDIQKALNQELNRALASLTTPASHHPIWSARLEESPTPSIVTIALQYQNHLSRESLAEALKIFMAQPYIRSGEAHYDSLSLDEKRALARPFLLPNAVKLDASQVDQPVFSGETSQETTKKVLLRIAFSHQQVQFAKKNFPLMRQALGDMATKFSMFFGKYGRDYFPS